MTGRNTFPERARRFYRGYRQGNIRLGHSLIKNLLERWLAPEQEVRLRSGLRMKLDLTKVNQAGIFWYDGDVDAPLIWAIRDLVPKGGIFVDCGANCGLMGLLAAQYHRARVFFFEPHPRLARTIEANVRLNGLESRTELIEAAVSNESGEVTFYEAHAGDDGTHSIHKDWGGGKGGEKRVLGKVRCETFKDIIQRRQIPHMDFLKIDTEGNDLPVLQSMAEYLRPDFARLIYVETTRDGEAICRLLAGRGYAGFSAVDRRGRELARMLDTYEHGGRVSFFRPMGPDLKCGDNTLWCDKNSPLARYLEDLDAGDRS